MRKFVAIAFALLTATAAFAAPQPKPPFPNKLVLSQGTPPYVVTRTLDVPSQVCSQHVGEARTSGVRQFRLDQKGCTVSGSYVQFPEAGGEVSSDWVYPAPPPPNCGQEPAPASQPGACPPGTVSHWTQTHGWACGADGTWQALPWQPVAPPPDSSCTPTSPPPSQWTAPLRGSSLATPPKPNKGASFIGPYGGMVTTRVTDHTADAQQSWLAIWYNRHQAFNADNTLFLVFQPNGFWDVYRVSDAALVKRLAGPGGDCEIHWDEHDPDALYYVATNGGTVMYKLSVASNTHTVYYDFTAAVHALWPDATQCWSKSEGSPTADGRFVGFMCEAIVGSDWITRGFVKLDLVAKAIVWSKTNTGDRPDNVSLTPSGRSFVISGLAPLGTTAWATDGSGSSRQLHRGVEHADLVKMPNGDDAIITENYQADGGPIYAQDIDTGAMLALRINIYGNPIFDNDPPPGSTQNRCTNCAVWPSGRAFDKPGWVIISTTEHAPSNVLLANIVTGSVYGLSAVFNVRVDYWDEAHCTVSRDLTLMACTMNFGQSLNDDVYITRLIALPES